MYTYIHIIYKYTYMHIYIYIWQCAIIYLPPPGGCNKNPEMCPEFLAGCLLPYSTPLHCPSGPISGMRSPPTILLQPGGCS